MNRPQNTTQTISPRELEILLQAFYLAEALKLTCQAHKDALERLERNGMIEPAGQMGCWGVTERGKAWVQAILSVPMPVSKTIWVLPDAA